MRLAITMEGESEIVPLVIPVTEVNNNTTTPMTVVLEIDTMFFIVFSTNNRINCHNFRRCSSSRK